MYTLYDPDEYEIVSHAKACRSCGGDMRKCNGSCNGSSGISMVKRPQNVIDAIKSERRRAHEEDVLAEAAAIMARCQIND
jgi:hypothetical protein